MYISYGDTLTYFQGKYHTIFLKPTDPIIVCVLASYHCGSSRHALDGGYLPQTHMSMRENGGEDKYVGLCIVLGNVTFQMGQTNGFRQSTARVCGNRGRTPGCYSLEAAPNSRRNPINEGQQLHSNVPSMCHQSLLAKPFLLHKNESVRRLSYS